MPRESPTNRSGTPAVVKYFGHGKVEAVRAAMRSPAPFMAANLCDLCPVMVLIPLAGSRQQLFGPHCGRAQFADDDAGGVELDKIALPPLAMAPGGNGQQ